MRRSTALRASGALARTRGALGRPHNWVQLAKFCTVGATGYVVNLGVYALLLGFGLHYLLAATGSFLVAVTNNYTWNRLWTFRGQRGHVGYQGLRFLVVSTSRSPRTSSSCTCSCRLGLGKVLAQAIAIVLVTPLNFVGNKLWSFRQALPASAPRWRRSRSPPPAAAAPSRARLRRQGRLVETPFAPPEGAARLTEEQATEILLPPIRRSPTGSTATRRTRRPTPSTGRRRTTGPSRSGRARPARSCSARSTTAPAR